MLRVCVWMDVPSHYQSDFFAALIARDDIDLQVRYLRGVSTARAAQGWSGRQMAESFEALVDGAQAPEQLLASVPEGAERIHLISNYMNAELVAYFCAKGIRWCHWSEMPGVRLVGFLGCRMALFRVLAPVMLMLKRKEGNLIRKHAWVAFGQGRMAGAAFRWMGVPYRKIADLYYAPAPLPSMTACEKIIEFAAGRKIFLAVGSLCPRKAPDLLLKAFARLQTKDWCLVFCGLDQANGSYHALADKLGIADRVLFHGIHPSDRIAEVYAAADVFVLPSRFDGWGAVLNEAASAGLPLIGTDLCGGTWHLVKEGMNGCRARAGSVRSLQSALRFFVENPDVIERFGHASKALYFQEFSPERNAERLVEALLDAGGGVEHA